MRQGFYHLRPLVDLSLPVSKVSHQVLQQWQTLTIKSDNKNMMPIRDSANDKQ